jgi:hypothetical protein
MIPDFEWILKPYLTLLDNNLEWSYQDTVDFIAEVFNVTDEERSETIPSGQKVLDYRVGFSRTILKRAGLIESTRHGYVRMTNKGLEELAKNPDLINFKSLRKLSNYEFTKGSLISNNVQIPKKRNLRSIDKFSYIKAIGNLLTYYKSDLEYIKNFQAFKKGQIESEKYLTKSPGTFKAFLNEFRIARNIDKTKTPQLLVLTNNWITGQYPDNVDAFAEFLKMSNLTRGKTMTSLASKVLFLNNPWKITPLDSRAKQTLGLRNNFYSEYLLLVHNFINQNQSEMQYYLESVNQHLTLIEASFENELSDLVQIRLNRFVDKILWTNGRD